MSVQPLLDVRVDALTFARLAWSLPGYVRRPITVQQATERARSLIPAPPDRQLWSTRRMSR